MVYINPASIPFPQARLERLRELTNDLRTCAAEQRGAMIDAARSETWGHPEILQALKDVVGNKCWYSEVHLDHHDPNVDHFRPKGTIREVDCDSLANRGSSPGYWWLAFEHRNFRLAAAHANQRRVDESTSGGKADYFPVRGDRAPEATEWPSIVEDYLPLDPCSKTDVSLLWFDPDGVPGSVDRPGKPLSEKDKERVRISIWLYHLDKGDIQKRRSETIRGILAWLDEANDDLRDWDPDGVCNLRAKARFDQTVSKIVKALEPKSLFAGAIGRVVRSRAAHYPWITEHVL
jgi:hypothetical protein